METVVVKFQTGFCINGIACKNALLVPLSLLAGSPMDNMKRNIVHQVEVSFPVSNHTYHVRVTSMKEVYSPRLSKALSLINHQDNLRVSFDTENPVSGVKAIELLSKFVLLYIDNFTSTSSVLVDESINVHLGDQVKIIGVPFGHDCNGLFKFMTWRGCVCGVPGSGSDLFLLDSRSLPTIEGCLVTLPEGPALGFVVACLESRAGGQTGLLLAAHVSLLGDLLPGLWAAPGRAQALGLRPLPVPAARAAAVTANVSGPGAWGTGVVLRGRFLVTCAHVIQFSSGVRPIVYLGDQRLSVGRCLFVAKEKSAFDIAVFELADVITADPIISDDIDIGGDCFVLGYGVLPRHISCDPMMTQGHVTNVNREDGKALMIQTDCLVNSGCSGAGVFRSSDGALAGLVVCNLSDEETVFPNANFCIPISYVSEAIRDYERSGDAAALQRLGQLPRPFRRLWVEAFDSLPRSKL